jgi:hypothetical protein
MTEQEVIAVLASFSKRLATIADRDDETREQARFVYDRLCLLGEAYRS